MLIKKLKEKRVEQNMKKKQKGKVNALNLIARSIKNLSKYNLH